MSDITLGQPYAVAAESGIGSGVGAVPLGAVVTPFEIAPPGTAGVGYSVEDTVLATYLDSVTVPGFTIERTLAIGVSLFEGSFAPYVPPTVPDPDPVDPVPADPAPVDPAPADPVPVDPALADPSAGDGA